MNDYPTTCARQHGGARASALALALLCGLLAGWPAAAASLTAKASVSASDVFVGEPFTLRIDISGSEALEQPDLSALKDFDVADVGGQRNSSRSVTMVNGRVNEVVNRGFVLTCRLTARRTGRLTIPAIKLRAEGMTARTQPITVTARKPEETDKFKLRMRLSKSRCYVGEPITLTVTWYLGQDVRGFQFSTPCLTREDVFAYADPAVVQARNTELFNVPVTGGQVTGARGVGKLDGQDYTTLEFRKVLFPKKSGTVVLAPVTVTCSALVGYREPRRRSNDLFSGFFGQRREEVLRNAVVPSNELTLEVVALPETGRPANFAGHVGEYRIDAAATPTDVNVGDPITLTIVVSGPEYLEHVSLPPLQEQASLIRDFRVPSEIAAGKASGRAKSFTQTLRALRPDVEAIPPIELPFFDTKTEAYRVARSEPIPLVVRATKVVTALDAEGLELPKSSGQELEAWTRGIAHNYEDMGVLEDRHYGLDAWRESPLLLALLVFPPLGYLSLLAIVTVRRRRHADPHAVRARRAFAAFLRDVKGAGEDGAGGETAVVLDSLRTYLGSRLRLPGGALTYRDAQPALAARGVSDETLRVLEGVFHECEAGRYAGNAGGVGASSVTDQAVGVVRELERVLK